MTLYALVTDPQVEHELLPVPSAFLHTLLHTFLFQPTSSYTPTMLKANIWNLQLLPLPRHQHREVTWWDYSSHGAGLGRSHTGSWGPGLGWPPSPHSHTKHLLHPGCFPVFRLQRWWLKPSDLHIPLNWRCHCTVGGLTVPLKVLLILSMSLSILAYSATALFWDNNVQF